METKTNFERAVACTMADWPALEIVVENYLGGPLGKEKARWLVEVTSDYLTTEECSCSTDLQEYLGVIMDQEFDALIEDGSLDEISQKLIILREEYKNGDIEKLAERVTTSLQNQKSASFLGDLLPTPEKKQSMPRTFPSTSNDSSSCDSATIPTPMDVDGWTVVTNKKHK